MYCVFLPVLLFLAVGLARAPYVTLRLVPHLVGLVVAAALLLLLGPVGLAALPVIWLLWRWPWVVGLVLLQSAISFVVVAVWCQFGPLFVVPVAVYWVVVAFEHYPGATKLLLGSAALLSILLCLFSVGG